MFPRCCSICPVYFSQRIYFTRIFSFPLFLSRVVRGWQCILRKSSQSQRAFISLVFPWCLLNGAGCTARGVSQMPRSARGLLLVALQRCLCISVDWEPNNARVFLPARVIFYETPRGTPTPPVIADTRSNVVFNTQDSPGPPQQPP